MVKAANFSMSTPRLDGYSISTGLPLLDAALCPVPAPANSSVGTTYIHSSPLAARWTAAAARHGPPYSSPVAGATQEQPVPSTASTGGIRRRELTEITGPRGVGKTTLAMEVAARVLLVGEKVVWIDTAGPLCLSRLRDVMRKQLHQQRQEENEGEGGKRSKSAERNAIDSALRRLLHFYAPSLAHIMALVSRPPAGFPPQNTGLFVIDNVSTLFNSEFKTFLPPSKEQQQQPVEAINAAATRPTNDKRRRGHPKTTNSPLDHQGRLRWKLVGHLLSRLHRLAIQLDTGVVVINEMSSRFRSGQRVMLHQALSGWTWEGGVASRIVLYFVWNNHRSSSGSGGKMRVRVAEVTKQYDHQQQQPLTSIGRRRAVAPYAVLKGGITELPRVRLRIEQRRPRKTTAMTTRLVLDSRNKKQKRMRLDPESYHHNHHRSDEEDEEFG